MKICLDIRVSTKGGTSTFIDNFVRELDGMSHPHELHFVFNPKTTSLNGRPRSVDPVPYRGRLGEFQWSQLKLNRILRRREIDIYHSLKHVGPLRCGVKTIYRVPAVGQFLGNYPLPAIEQIYWKHIAGRAYRQADLLIAVSSYVATALIDHLGIPSDKVVTVHNGVDPRFQPLEIDRIDQAGLRSLGVRDDYLLCVGNLVPVKNFTTAIEAYAILRSRQNSLPQLVLAGGQSDPHFAQLVECVKRHQLKNDILFVGYQSAEELLHLYNGAIALVHPSLHEGFSFTILEAMACGLPIVAAASTSIPEAAGDAARYHQDPFDAEELAVQLQELLDDGELRSELSRRGIQRVTQYSWQACVKKTIEAYDLIA